MTTHYWGEEHRIGDYHYHIYDDKLSQKELHSRILQRLDQIKGDLSWRDSESVWDSQQRMYIQVSLVRQKASLGRGRPYRIHISVFPRADELFKQLITKLGAEEADEDNRFF